MSIADFLHNVLVRSFTIFTHNYIPVLTASIFLPLPLSYSCSTLDFGKPVGGNVTGAHPAPLSEVMAFILGRFLLVLR